MIFKKLTRHMTAKSLMVLGSMSSAGKSLLVTGLCRLYARRGYRVAPFKAQNMSNNAAVCSGGEIGRAQAVQAHAAGIEPTVDMNPVLLKPESDSSSQVIIHGKVWESFSAADYFSRKEILWQAVTESIDRQKDKFDLLIMEGAGSPAEINLYQNDIVNIAAARYATAPCLLAGDIDRGGIFAQMLGTLWLLEEADRRLIRGLIVNKFRGDLALFSDGICLLEEKGGVPVLGVVPYLHDHGIAEEDAATIGDRASGKPGLPEIVVIHLPHISNYDDVDPLAAEPDVNIRFVTKPEQLGNPAAVIIPGTKNTLHDLAWLHKTGLAERIKQFANKGVRIVGLCGGFQMLCESVADDLAVESQLTSVPGLALLPGATRFGRQKTATRSQARITSDAGFFRALRGTPVFGYEIHMGQTDSPNPLSRIESREGEAASALDGACSPDAHIWGTYLHGIFENDLLRKCWLNSLGIVPSPVPFNERRASAYNGLADVLESSLDIPLLDRLIEDGI